jgi:hypothetical protein
MNITKQEIKNFLLSAKMFLIVTISVYLILIGYLTALIFFTLDYRLLLTTLILLIAWQPIFIFGMINYQSEILEKFRRLMRLGEFCIYCKEVTTTHCHDCGKPICMDHSEGTPEQKEGEDLRIIIRCKKCQLKIEKKKLESKFVA